MIIARLLVLTCVLNVAAVTAVAAASRHVNTKPAQAMTPGSDLLPAKSRVLRQDLFDRKNPNNIRTDWPAPPFQPAQF
jgi:uncharacterized membrane protein